MFYGTLVPDNESENANGEVPAHSHDNGIDQAHVKLHEYIIDLEKRVKKLEKQIPRLEKAQMGRRKRSTGSPYDLNNCACKKRR